LASHQIADAAKDAGIGAAGIGAWFLNQSWQDVVSDFILVATAVLVTLRIAWMLRQWWRGKSGE
jgi:hypothetical protein